jgi:hypothetical protein
MSGESDFSRSESCPANHHEKRKKLFSGSVAMEQHLPAEQASRVEGRPKKFADPEQVELQIVNFHENRN